MANRLRSHRRLEYELVVEGDLREQVTAAVPDSVDTTHVSFVQVRVWGGAQKGRGLDLQEARRDEGRGV